MSKVKNSIMLHASVAMSYVMPFFAHNPYSIKKKPAKKNNLTSGVVIWSNGQCRKAKQSPQGKRAKKEFRKTTHLRGYYLLVKRGLIDAHRNIVKTTAN